MDQCFDEMEACKERTVPHADPRRRRVSITGIGRMKTSKMCYCGPSLAYDEDNKGFSGDWYSAVAVPSTSYGVIHANREMDSIYLQLLHGTGVLASHRAREEGEAIGRKRLKLIARLLLPNANKPWRAQEHQGTTLDFRVWTFRYRMRLQTRCA